MQGMNLTLRLILVVASALLASTVFAPLSWWFLAVVAWIPLFVGIYGTSAKVGGRLCLLHGVIYFGITMAWITKVFVGMSWAIVPLAFIMAFFSMFFGAGYAALSTRYQKGWLVALGGACWWLAVRDGACRDFRPEIPLDDAWCRFGARLDFSRVRRVRYQFFYRTWGDVSGAARKGSYRGRRPAVGNALVYHLAPKSL